jgi:hypothetical protein
MSPLWKQIIKALFKKNIVLSTSFKEWDKLMSKSLNYKNINDMRFEYDMDDFNPPYLEKIKNIQKKGEAFWDNYKFNPIDPVFIQLAHAIDIEISIWFDDELYRYTTTESLRCGYQLIIDHEDNSAYITYL